MFSKFLKKGGHQELPDMAGVVGKGMFVEGNLSFEGTVRIDGHFKGEIKSAGILLVGEEALIEAHLDIDTAIISGEVRGVINAKNKVELRAPAKIFGEIRTPTLIIGEGVIFDGKCVMTERPQIKTVEEVAS